MRIVFDTDAAPEDERFAYYREGVLATLYPMTPELDPNSDQRFRARLEARQVADAMAVLCEGTPHTIGRTRDDVAKTASDCYYVFHQLGRSPAVFRHDHAEPVLAQAGDLILGDADSPFGTPATPAGYHHRFWLLPKAVIDPLLPNAGARLSGTVHLSGTHGVAALLGSHLSALNDQAAHPDVTGNSALTANLAHLIAIALGTARPDEPQHAALAEARRVQALRWIARDYADPALSPAIVAARLGVSLRTLHASFESSGTSFAEQLARRRLEASRLVLASPAARGQSVAGIAFACGFNDVSTFHRAFRRAYGFAPSDLRPAR